MPVPVPEGYDLTDPDIYAKGVPLEDYAWLRLNAPVFWNAQTVEESSFDDGGLWVLSRHEDVKTVSCARSGWSSEENTAIVRFDGKTVGYQERQIQKHMMLNMDEPRHTRVRSVVSRGIFTPRSVERLEGMLGEWANNIVLDAKQNIEMATKQNFTAEATTNMGLKGTAGITVESPAQAEVKSATTTVKGDGMLTLKGGAVMIN